MHRRFFFFFKQKRVSLTLQWAHRSIIGLPSQIIIVCINGPFIFVCIPRDRNKLNNHPFAGFFFFGQKGEYYLIIYIRIYATIGRSSPKGYKLLVPRFSISHTKGTYTKAVQVLQISKRYCCWFPLFAKASAQEDVAHLVGSNAFHMVTGIHKV